MDTTGDINLVELWLRRDPIRWAAGALAGLFGGLIMAAFAMILAVAFGYEAWYPIKIAAIPLLGSSATAYGIHLPAIMGGFIIHELLAMILGVVYAHFAATNHLGALLGAGFVWGTFSWIFINNLFIQSFNSIFALEISGGAAFFVLLVFGLSLTSVAFFDRMLRGQRT